MSSVRPVPFRNMKDLDNQSVKNHESVELNSHLKRSSDIIARNNTLVETFSKDDVMVDDLANLRPESVILPVILPMQKKQATILKGKKPLLKEPPRLIQPM